MLVFHEFVSKQKRFTTILFLIFSKTLPKQKRFEQNCVKKIVKTPKSFISLVQQHVQYGISVKFCDQGPSITRETPFRKTWKTGKPSGKHTETSRFLTKKQLFSFFRFFWLFWWFYLVVEDFKSWKFAIFVQIFRNPSLVNSVPGRRNFATPRFYLTK